MNKVVVLDKYKKSRQLSGQDFSPQDLLDFINSLNLAVGAEWCKNNFCNISIFYPKTGKMKEEVAYFDFNDWNPLCNRLIITIYKKRFDVNLPIGGLMLRISCKFLVASGFKEKKRPE